MDRWCQPTTTPALRPGPAARTMERARPRRRRPSPDDGRLFTSTQSWSPRQLVAVLSYAASALRHRRRPWSTRPRSDRERGAGRRRGAHAQRLEHSLRATSARPTSNREYPSRRSRHSPTAYPLGGTSTPRASLECCGDERRLAVVRHARILASDFVGGCAADALPGYDSRSGAQIAPLASRPVPCERPHGTRALGSAFQAGVAPLQVTVR